MSFVTTYFDPHERFLGIALAKTKHISGTSLVTEEQINKMLWVNGTTLGNWRTDKMDSRSDREQLSLPGNWRTDKMDIRSDREQLSTGKIDESDIVIDENIAIVQYVCIWYKLELLRRFSEFTSPIHL